MKSKNKKKNKSNWTWIFKAIVISFVLTIFFSLVTEQLLDTISLPWAFFLLIIIVSIGVFFDTVGIAVASSVEKPFHAMASRRIIEAKYAVLLVKNADVVANVCNDVVGDICGILSGAAGTIIVSSIIEKKVNLTPLLVSVILSGMIASFTVGGKAFGKIIAIKRNQSITYYAAKILYAIDSKIGFVILKDNRVRRLKNGI